MRWNRALAANSVTGQHGFTLLELLVVIAVLGGLSGAAVVGVSAVRTRAQESACAADARDLDTAEEAAFVTGESYLPEDELISAGYLREASTKHDIVLVADGYQLVPVGECAGSGQELAEGPGDGAGDETAAAEDEAAMKKAEAEQAAKEAEAAKAAEAAEAAKAAEQAKAEEAEAAKTAEKAEEEAAAKEKAEEEAAAKRKAEEAEAKKKAEEEAAAAGKGCKRGQIDVNTASKRELTKIDHVGGDEATRITKQRPFADLRQLTEVKGLDDKDVADIIEQGLACVA